MENINKITLECLLNPTLYEKYLNKNNTNTTDKNFYKERIIELTSNLFDSKTQNNALNNAFDNYILEAINHLYYIDKTNVFQETYSDLSFNVNLDNINTIFDISKNDSLIAIKKKKPITNYVIKKNTSVQESYPIQKKFNPLDNKYKTLSKK